MAPPTRLKQEIGTSCYALSTIWLKQKLPLISITDGPPECFKSSTSSISCCLLPSVYTYPGPTKDIYRNRLYPGDVLSHLLIINNSDFQFPFHLGKHYPDHPSPYFISMVQGLYFLQLCFGTFSLSDLGLRDETNEGREVSNVKAGCMYILGSMLS